MQLSKGNLQRFLKENQGYKVLKRCEDTTLLRLPSGDVVKILDDTLLAYLSYTGYNLEERLQEVGKMKDFSSFALPTMMLEDCGVVTAYVMPYIDGVDFTDYYEDVLNLTSYAKIHHQIEENIQEGNRYGIVFPDLCTTENIRITKEKKVMFLDYDGLQIGQMPAIGFSDFLGERIDVLTGKYYDVSTSLFSFDLDVRSAIFLYFVDVFGINLAAVGKVSYETGKKVTLDDLFSMIQLEDVDIQQKVWKLYEPSIPNAFLGNDLDRLAENYTLQNSPTYPGIKQLVKR